MNAALEPSEAVFSCVEVVEVYVSKMSEGKDKGGAE